MSFSLKRAQREGAGSDSPIFRSPRLWEGEAQHLLPPSSQIPVRPVVDGRKAQDKHCFGLFVFIMTLFMIQSVSSIFSANYELPHNFAECEKRVQEESIQVNRRIPMKEINQAAQAAVGSLQQGGGLSMFDIDGNPIQPPRMHADHAHPGGSKAAVAAHAGGRGAKRLLLSGGSGEGGGEGGWSKGVGEAGRGGRGGRGLLWGGGGGLQSLAGNETASGKGNGTANSTAAESEDARMRQDEKGFLDVGEALMAAGASWTVVWLLSVSSLLLGVLWIVLLGEFTKPIIYITLYMLPVALCALSIAAWALGGSTEVKVLLAGLFVAALLCIYLARERLALTSALLTCASKALSSNYSLVAVAIFLSFVQITWLVTCFLFIGLSFMSGQAVVVPRNKASGVSCAWETDGWAYVGMLFIVFQTMWTNQIVSDLKRFVVCAGIGVWYADTDKHPGVGVEELKRAWGSYGLTALWWGLSCSFGSLCMSSLVVVPCTLIRYTLQPSVQHLGQWEEGCFEKAEHEQEEPESAFERLGAWWEGMCKRVWDFVQLESILGFIDRMAVPVVAITGHPFCHSAKMSSVLLSSNNLTQVVADRTNAWVLRVGSAVLACVSAAGAAVLYQEYVSWAVNDTGKAVSVSHLVVWVVFWGSLIASALVLQFLAGILLDAMDGLFVLYAMDRHNKTVTGRGAELHMMLTAMQVGRPASGRRYTPRGWTYLGSEPTSTWNSAKFLVAQGGTVPEGSDEGDEYSGRTENSSPQQGSPLEPHEAGETEITEV